MIGKRIKLLFPKISEIATTSSKKLYKYNGVNGVGIILYNKRNLDNIPRKSYPLVDINEHGLYMHSIYDDLILGIDIVQPPINSFGSPTLVMDLDDFL